MTSEQAANVLNQLNLAHDKMYSVYLDTSKQSVKREIEKAMRMLEAISVEIEFPKQEA